MRFSPLGAFKDSRTRPRAIIWSAIALMGFVLLWAGGLIGTSTYWFCTTPCHIVHDDNTAAYHASTHKNVSCIACHEPVNASPITFTLMKIHVLPDLPATIFKTFELPANGKSQVAVDMPSGQCTQCHNMANRKVTPSKGIIIDHEKHAKLGVTCATCHNRVAHPEEEIELKLAGNRKHENWIKMDGCFRCHGDEKYAEAPTKCSACHTKKFDLEPATHDKADWYTSFGDSRGHAEAALEESRSIEESRKLAEEGEEIDAEKAQGPILRPAGTVNSCNTCHEQKFCESCHGLDIPHTKTFVKQHSKAGYAEPAKCAKCHARSKAEAAARLGACESCHHKEGKPGIPWTQQHPAVVKAKGTDGCFKCHDALICSKCHVKISTQLR